MNQKFRSFRNESGFTLLELMVVVALMGVLAAMAIMVSPAFTQTARADASISQVLDAVRSAREVAISQRRNVRLTFLGANAIQTVRENIDGTGAVTSTTVLRTVELENRMVFQKVAEITKNTPDGFPWTDADGITFSAAAPWTFTSEGTFVGATGDPTNGTLMLSIPSQPNSSRAISIMGATALIRVWRWNGTDWVE
jgi:prepilin-type N-terminal cleavage/methylation domain-containing protein